jgi:hypothetical protein
MRFQTVLTVSGLALAMPFAHAVTTANPDEVSAAVPIVHYDSAFNGYQAYQSQEPGSWREHNDAMAAVGGHAGHLKGSAPSAEQPPAAQSEMPKGMTDHGMHKK